MINASTPPFPPNIAHARKVELALWLWGHRGDTLTDGDLHIVATYHTSEEARVVAEALAMRPRVGRGAWGDRSTPRVGYSLFVKKVRAAAAERFTNSTQEER